MAERASLMSIDEASPDEAYARVLAEAKQLVPAQIREVNLDIGRVIDVAMAAAKRIPQFEAQLRALSGFSVENLDCLADYTLALYSAHIRYTFLATPTEVLPALNEDAIRWRNILLTEAKSLAAREVIRADRLKPLTGRQGVRNVARDLGGLVQIFKADWEHIKDDTGLKCTKIEEVGKLALKLTNAIATRKRTPEELKAAKDIRARMFTLLSRAYDAIRRAMQYIRGERGDTDRFVPSLYSRRRRSSEPKNIDSAPVEGASLRDSHSNMGMETPEQTSAPLLPQFAAVCGPRVPDNLPDPLLPDNSSTEALPRESGAVVAGSRTIRNAPFEMSLHGAKLDLRNDSADPPMYTVDASSRGPWSDPRTSKSARRSGTRISAGRGARSARHSR